MYLKNQNFQLREELAEVRRKADRQEKEIEELRRMVTELGKQVNALKEGCGPFVQQQEATSNDATTRD